MRYKKNLKMKPEPLTYSNKTTENTGINNNYDRISAKNTILTKNMLAEIDIENTFDNKNKNTFGCLMYKSIFNSLGKKAKNPIKEKINNITDNNINLLKGNEKIKYYISNKSNKKNSKNQNYTLNLKKQFKNVKNEHSEKANDLDYNLNNPKGDEFDDFLNNYSGANWNKDIQYEKNYSSKQNSNNESSRKKVNYIVINDFKVFDFENDVKKEDLEEIPQKNKKTLNYQKSEDNLNKNYILDKQEFMKNIKEINDLEFIDENKNELFSEKDILSNNQYFNENKNLRSNKKDDKTNSGRNYRNKNLILFNNNQKSITMNSIKSPQNSFISTSNNSNLNKLAYNKNTYNNSINNKNMSKSKEKLYMNNLSNYEKNLNDNNMKINDITSSNTNNSLGKKNIYGIDSNTNSFYNNKNLTEKKK